MGNCWVSFSKEANPTTPITTFIHNPTRSGVSNNSSYTTEMSATSSSAGKSQFSEAVNEGGEEASADGQILDKPNLKAFSFADLKLATKNFRSDTLLGKGGFGNVYRGWIDEKTFAPSKSGNGMVVAIKKLNPESLEGFQEWQTEVNFLGRLSHPNLVKLLGYCQEDKELLVVYEFMQNGSLGDHLFRRHPFIEPLSWNIRLKIAIGVARGLGFLHSSEEKVIYRDVKTTNILLDEYFNAKLGDFGLAKLGPAGGKSHVTTRVMGTYGYAAPEYVTTGHLYVKSDVYGFGVMLLEMLTGLRAFDTERPRGEENLVDWMKPTLSGKKLRNIMDARIEGQYSTQAAQQVVQLSRKCLNLDPKHRPSMKEVVEILEHVEAMNKKPRNSVFM
ncbi:LOW QUALITY PROTEIN: probable serine/threonine-protein kinase PIX13 [Mangifera indica]|uniref:LOW QUALITY PROTEIN: probable serine/threonine-protein kinase PIX13 n=1 Tax=Mangifera indica TaxID=29780 RepID=UPI001CFAB532|nr:LOW QUALITY PROTEIN: probable serine/threonine-protein kinase PIX13 [Mangifera indica]